MTELLEVLEKLGWPAAKRTELAAVCDKELGRAGEVPRTCPEAGKTLTAAARQLEAVAMKSPGADGDEIARCALRLDARIEGLQKRLGNERVGELWLPVEHRDLRERRVEMLDAVRLARELAVDFECGEIQDERLKLAGAERGIFVRREPFEIRTTLPRGRAEQIMRDVNRCMALSRWLRGQPLEIPARPKVPKVSRVYWVFDSNTGYDRVRQRLKADGRISPEDREIVDQLGSFNDDAGGTLFGWSDQARQTAELFTYMSFLPQGRACALTAGHFNWITTNLLGTPLPNFVWVNRGERDGDTIAPGRAAERHARVARESLAWSGVEGNRTWMRFLAERHEDPPFARSFVDQIGMIRGDDLLKCTSIAEYLCETKQFAALYDKLGPTQEPGDTKDVLARSAFASVGELEARWRAWILAGRPSLAERITDSGGHAILDSARVLLELLEEVRSSTRSGGAAEFRPLMASPELGQRAARHAAYIAQLGRPPENPTREEAVLGPRTPEGAWAAANSIVLNARDKRLDAAFMRAFEDLGHRVALLDPGLGGIGAADQGATTVLDVRSLRGPRPWYFETTWPFDGQTGVPVAHPELGPWSSPEARAAAQLGKGIPILLLARAEDATYSRRGVDLRLLLGAAEVECTASSPDAPATPALALSDAWILVPKEPLRAKARYTVQARWSDGTARTWSFRTK
ncbi:MAG: hypothetical protein IPJ77_05975 [Planctomycetes bacterium]|nr:hypothetical protein [Planctomycetota bacterium]